VPSPVGPSEWCWRGPTASRPTMCWRQNFTGRATLCGAGLKLALSPRLNFETIFGHFLPAMNLVSPTRDHLVILAGVVEIMRFNWITP
jgi:hypothetical protein